MSQPLHHYTYTLPPELIARFPLPERRASRLLVLNVDGRIEHRAFAEFPALLVPGDLLVVNDTRVIPARLFVVKDSGGRAELLVERIEADDVALCHVRVSKALKPERTLDLESGGTVRVLSRCGELYRLAFPRPVLDVLRDDGEIPLPPYLERRPVPADSERYQTVYARNPGAVAAPTAGLHFDEPLLAEVESRGVAIAHVTLHVGAGTFQPVRGDDLATHQLHSERVIVSDATIAAIERARAARRRVIAVGTTVVRALETAGQRGAPVAVDGDTSLFIRPGHRFRVVDALLTNFHLPRSTLLVLVCAFAGRERVLAAYDEAVSAHYRFFSYGDAMFIPTRSDVDEV